MDTSKLNEDEAREVLGKMLTEISNTFNSMHARASSSDDEVVTDDDSEQTKKTKASAMTTSEPAEFTETGEPKKKRKKKKKKPAKPEIDKFLEESADIPLEELQMFDPSKSVAERVELAVTRFRKNRNLNQNIRGKIFDVYLDYGGIRTGPKSFQGGGVQTGGPNDEGGEPDYEAMNAGVDRVDDDPNLVVDFTNVVATFLSQYFLESTGWVDKIYYTDAPLVIAALLNYFLVRNVLPEYTDDIKSALAITERAKVELPSCKEISNGITSRFDKACSVLYGGQYFGFLEDGQWQSPEYYVKELGMDMATAEAIVQSVAGPEVDIHSLKLKDKTFMDLEIERVEFPELPAQPALSEQPEESEPSKTGKVQEDQNGSSADEEAKPECSIGSTGDDAVVSDGKVQSKSPAQEPSDPLAEAAKELRRIKEVPVFAKVILMEWDRDGLLDQPQTSNNRKQLRWCFDAALAAKMVPGMKIVAQVHTLSNGLTYFEQAVIYPSYYMEADVDETPLEEDSDE